MLSMGYVCRMLFTELTLLQCISVDVVRDRFRSSNMAVCTVVSRVTSCCFQCEKGSVLLTCGAISERQFEQRV